MNNKGQTLIIFVLFLPIIFLLIAVVYDIGSLETEKYKIENEIKSTIEYGLNNIKSDNLEDEIYNLLDKNIAGTKTIGVDSESIKINVKYKKESIFPNIIKDNYQINITYKGSIKDNKIKIIKE
ncbi:MAG: hypothetical protein IKE75_01825 [Bacilli bacterium]|nr:hypothetical protein [Bacilli bacterium]